MNYNFQWSKQEISYPRNNKIKRKSLDHLLEWRGDEEGRRLINNIMVSMPSSINHDFDRMSWKDVSIRTSLE